VLAALQHVDKRWGDCRSGGSDAGGETEEEPFVFVHANRRGESFSGELTSSQRRIAFHPVEVAPKRDPNANGRHVLRPQ
jgi:hypothetical protein